MEPHMWLLDWCSFCWCTQWTHSDVWSQLATTPNCVFPIGYRQSRKKWRNCNRRAIHNATRSIGARRAAVCNRGVSASSDGVRSLRPCHSAWTEMFFADDASHLSIEEEFEIFSPPAKLMTLAASLPTITMIWLKLLPVATQPRTSVNDSQSAETYSSTHVISLEMKITKKIGDTGEPSRITTSTGCLYMALPSIIISTVLSARTLCVHRLIYPSICLTFMVLIGLPLPHSGRLP